MSETTTAAPVIDIGLFRAREAASLVVADEHDAAERVGALYRAGELLTHCPACGAVALRTKPTKTGRPHSWCTQCWMQIQWRSPICQSRLVAWARRSLVAQARGESLVPALGEVA